MKALLSILLVFALVTCRPDKNDVKTPKTSIQKPTAIDGMRTDEVDTLISKEEVVLDSIILLNE